MSRPSSAMPVVDPAISSNQSIAPACALAAKTTV
jgi:hypothetical protein